MNKETDRESRRIEFPQMNVIVKNIFFIVTPRYLQKKLFFKIMISSETFILVKVGEELGESVTIWIYGEFLNE